MGEKLLTTREAAKALGFSEKEVIDLAQAGLLPHFKLGGEFLRFREGDVLAAKGKIKKKYNLLGDESQKVERLKEFLYFNDFYIIATIAIVVLLWIILKGVLF